MKALLLSLALAFWASQANAAPNKLSGVATKRIGPDFFVELTFADDISEKDVAIDYVDRTIEVLVPRAVVARAKGLTKIGDETVERLFTGQAPGNAVRCKIVLTAPNQASQFKASTAILSRANKLFVKVGSPAASAPAAIADTRGTTGASATSEMNGALIDQLMQVETGAAPKTASADEATALLAPVSAAATTTATSATSADENQPVFKSEASVVKDKVQSSAKLWTRMVLSLLVVLAVFGGGLYGFKKWPGSKKLAASRKMIEVLAQHHLGAKRSVAVIRVAGESVLIGVTDNNISVLKTLALLDEEFPGANQNHQKFNTSLAGKIENEVARTSEREEEFSMQGLREIIGNRLKTMREL